MSSLILASASTRRSQLLAQVGLAHQVQPVDIDETWRAGESLNEYVARLAREKARAGAAQLPASLKDCVILAADTAGEVAGERLIKPRDYTHAHRMLSAMSGQAHTVATGICVYQPQAGRIRSKVVSSLIHFIALTDDDIAQYWATGEPFDKAGAYAIQGRGACWVSRIEGSYSGIVGLPLAETVMMLKDAGIAPSSPDNYNGNV